MEILISDFISWQYFIILLLIILFILWLFWGGQKNLKFIGLAPLKIGVDATRNIEHGEEEEEEIIDKTPTLPDLTPKQKKNGGINFVNFHEGGKVPTISLSESIDFSSQPPIDNLVYPNHNSNGMNRKRESPKTPVGLRMPQEISQGMPQGISQGMAQEISQEIKTPRTLALGEFTCFNNKKISKGETLSKQAIEDIFKVPFYCVRPDFLKNPETGRNLELDLYNDDLKIAVEYSGKQHFVFPNTFHKTKEEFLNQVRRDQFKVEMCDKNGVYLITVPYNVGLEYEKIKAYIEHYLPENRIERGSYEQK